MPQSSEWPCEVRPAIDKPPGWRVLRKDDNGNVFVITEVATEAEARATAAEFEARGHKQMYSVELATTGLDSVRAATTSTC
jgi:hypothetical protein